MKKVLKGILYCCAFALCVAPMTGCSDDEGTSGGDNGVRNINNPKEGMEISSYGDDFSITFTTDAAWEAELEMADNGNWCTIMSLTNNQGKGTGAIRLEFDPNEETETRTVNVYVTVNGFSRTQICSLTQAATSDSPALSAALIEKMDERLKNEYLWKDAYNELAANGEIDKDVSYSNFLYTNLTKLGDVNIEDGGYYRAYSANYGKRYIYSYIEETTSTASVAANGKTTRTSVSGDLGFGYMLSSRIWENDPTIALVLGYVRQGSPAETAGLQRGDCIFEVNGVTLNSSNYATMSSKLFAATSGTYRLGYARYEDVNGSYVLVNHETTVTAKAYNYNPVITLGVLKNRDGEQGPDGELLNYNIGYMVYERFDADAIPHAYLKAALEELKSQGITDLILDLRFNGGGSVAQSRYLAGAIAGSANWDKTFAYCKFVDETEEDWRFGKGQQPSGDGLGEPVDLGLNKVQIICSENTASAAELLINSLKGIDFDVTLYGSKTEGKNVGMTTTQYSVGSRTFEYAPVNFWAMNAKRFGDYADGMEVDKVVNSQDGKWTGHLDNYFPYGFLTWGQFDADPALYWAYYRSIFGKDPQWDDDADATAKMKTVYKAMSRYNNSEMRSIPAPMKQKHRGNIIHGSEIEKL